MSVKNFRFVSPGVFVNEIDNSQVPASPAGIGPVVIGRAEKGPSLRPVTVNSFSEFVNVFGAPSPGTVGGDVWRKGQWSTSAPTYGAYAAQAYLKNSSPLTYIRLLGADADSASGAGVAGWDAGTNGKAWGLVVFSNDASWANGASGSLEGALAAIFYTTGASTYLQMSGAIAVGVQQSIVGALPDPVWTGGNNHTGSNVVVKDTGKAYEFRMIINDADSNSSNVASVFNFDPSSAKYIRKVFNTTPQRTNTDIVSDEQNYFLGESFDRHMKSVITATAGKTFATVINLTNATDGDSDNFRAGVQSSETPYIIGCDTAQRSNGSSNNYDIQAMPTLFRVIGLNDAGDWTNRNLKVSIQDIKVSSNESDPYGSFSLVVRRLSDSDNVVQIVEQFNDLNLNPDSLNYIARKIGDKYTTWNTTERRYVQVGDWDNVSKYIRVDMNEDVVGSDAALLPFGFRGIIKYDDEAGINQREQVGNWITGSVFAESTDVGSVARPYLQSGSLGGDTVTTGVFIVSGSCLTASVSYPAPELRLSASDGDLSNTQDAYFGMQTSRTTGGTVFDASNIDMLRPRGGEVANMFAGISTGIRERSMYFSLDDVKANGIWASGSHALGTALTNTSGAVSGVLDAGYDRFTVPMYGGFDGLDITELDPFRNSQWDGASPTDDTSYTFNTIRRSIDSLADPEVVEMNLATIPGLKQPGLTSQLINVCEDRADALAVIDVQGGYKARAEGTTSARNNTAAELATVINDLRTRAINSSYACTFYPWLRCRDTINGAMVWLPPSVAALGTFSSSQKKTQVWFAPAGFNRGGLTEGAAGIPVTDVAHQLRRKDRDDLYAANINPIAKFPAEGIVIFGQKTLQVTPSALDRINVRRLMIFVKKRISQVAANLLFDPNVKTTWNRFISSVEPILADIKTNFGLSDYKLILDDTTTTPDLVDRNIMYARIYLKPTRAIEYIAIDFNITRTGASFDD
jgi:phage tail sheath protein FI